MLNTLVEGNVGVRISSQDAFFFWGGGGVGSVSLVESVTSVSRQTLTIG